MIAAVIASFNEMANPFFWDNIALLYSQCELIVVDGGSSDGTRERLATLGMSVHTLEGSTRAARYNLGVAKSTGNPVLLVHPRTRLSQEALEQLSSQPLLRTWGAFTHSFDEWHWLFLFTSWWSNRVRGDGRGIYYLDHCLFFTRDLQAEAVFPDVAIFEDTLFCQRLRRLVKPVRLRAKVVTSSIRFRKNGLLRQSVMNQVMKLMFFLRIPKRLMNSVYERGLGLNGRR